MINALLLSNSTMPGTPFFTWPKPYVKHFLNDCKAHSALFVPWAAVTFSFDDYEAKVQEAFQDLDVHVKSIHHESDMQSAVSNLDIIIIGGGNTFALLSRIQEHKLVAPIQEAVQKGARYIGWSAGANLACPTIMTTNDMPVAQPSNFNGLGLIPFQVNPHYHELKFEGQGGETRRERLEEFIAMNPHRKVVGLPEGMLLEVGANAIELKGQGIAKVYRHGMGVEALPPGIVNI